MPFSRGRAKITSIRLVPGDHQIEARVEGRVLLIEVALATTAFLAYPDGRSAGWCQVSWTTPGVPATTSHSVTVSTGDDSSNSSATARKVACQRSGVTSHIV